MRHSHRRITHSALAVVALTLAFAPAFPVGLGGAVPPAIQSIAIHGNVVTITVANPTATPVSAIVTIRVSTTEGATLQEVPVSIGPEGTASASIGSPAPVTGVLPLGVVLDDGVPF